VIMRRILPQADTARRDGEEVGVRESIAISKTMKREYNVRQCDE